MSTTAAVSSPDADASTRPPSGADRTAQPSPITFEAAFSAVRAAVFSFQEKPEDPNNLVAVRKALWIAAKSAAELPKRNPSAPGVSETLALLREVIASGAHDFPVVEIELQTARGFAATGWPGLLAAMLMVPSWQWPDAPRYDEVPDWLWADFTFWVFAAPQGFTGLGHAEIYAAHTLKRLEELARWADRNSGSQAVRSAIETYARSSSAIPLYFSHQSLRRHAELRGRILTRGFVKPNEAHDPFHSARFGRKLRVGFVNRHFGSQTETYTTLPSFEHLDPTRFEVILFAHHSGDTPLETYCRSRAREFYQLEGDLGQQLSTLRTASLDVVVFGTNVTAVCNEVSLLALHRVAPLQVVNNSSCITSGFPEIDLYVSGTLTEIPQAETHFSERLGLLPGPAHAFNYEADRQEPTTSWSRTALGIPNEAIIFSSAANYFKIIPEVQQAWARLLATVPGSYLLVHPFNPNWSSTYPIQRFCAQFDEALKNHGVDPSRLVVSTAKFPSRSDVKELLRISDVYLDTYPFGGVNSLVDPLELGLPVVVWEGETFRSRMGAALLRSLNLKDFIARDEPSYLSIATKLSCDSALRQALGENIRLAIDRQPIFLDALAASDAFGDLIEASFDEIVASGRKAFRARREPMRAIDESVTNFSILSEADATRAALRLSPADPAIRHRLGRVLLAEGENTRAAQYLLAAVQQDERNGPLWFDLATAFRRCGQSQEALQALEASLQIDKTQVEAWLLMAELARAVGSHDLAREAASVAQSLAPNDPRLATYAV